ncbi:MAG TPA: hypothetical protein VG826_05300 [Pirellulales bacterium]|nr:hypothetical protein [Pirellulales bacterium]
MKPGVHPVIARLQSDTDPTNAVREMLQGASIIAQAVGVKVGYTVESVDPTATPDPQVYRAGLRHLHSALAMLGVRASSILTQTIEQTKKLPHQR